eukprot:scaffold9208_cov154-Amphora_coffeaeformis.AAC.12
MDDPLLRVVISLPSVACCLEIDVKWDPPIVLLTKLTTLECSLSQRLLVSCDGSLVGQSRSAV